jgi:hypothetical protein
MNPDEARGKSEAGTAMKSPKPRLLALAGNRQQIGAQLPTPLTRQHCHGQQHVDDGALAVQVVALELRRTAAGSPGTITSLRMRVLPSSSVSGPMTARKMNGV